MMALPDSQIPWGAPYRLIAAEKWKAKSAAMGIPLTETLVEFAQPRSGMQVLDLATGTGEPAISLAQRLTPTGHVSGVDRSEEHTSDSSHVAISYAVFCLKKKTVVSTARPLSQPSH